MVAITLMAFLTVHLRFATDRFSFTSGPVGRLALTVLLAAGLAYLGWQDVRRASESLWLARWL